MTPKINRALARTAARDPRFLSIRASRITIRPLYLFHVSANRLVARADREQALHEHASARN